MKSIEMLKAFWRDEDGGEIVEYALVVGLLVVGIAGLMVTISGHVGTLFGAIGEELGLGAAEVGP
ncbi:Flp family type IVb pilin [Thiocystis violacea]|uniref:Flp family type IVb pilin n=1 Tax=Thiocystis violacea TaxID=13725 RepID=UPI001905F08C|nr:Flp family type IVb pilin [Thiocystis violacea]